jgi:predicted nucleic acid-binding Zn ribbon protein
VRRPAPRPLRLALARATGAAEPAGLLARVQSVWSEVAGAVIADQTEPVSERGGVVTIACGSAVWAQELELLGRDLEERLNSRLGPAGGVSGLRFRIASGVRS